MNDSESSVEEITHLENHLNDTILKILDEDQLCSTEEKKKRPSLLSENNITNIYQNYSIHPSRRNEHLMHQKANMPLKLAGKTDSEKGQQNYYSPKRLQFNNSNTFVAGRQANLSNIIQPTTQHFSQPLSNFTYSNYNFTPYGSNTENFRQSFPNQPRLSSQTWQSTKLNSASSYIRDYQSQSNSTNDSKNQTHFRETSMSNLYNSNSMPYFNTSQGCYMMAYPYNAHVPQSQFTVRAPSSGSKYGSYSGFSTIMAQQENNSLNKYSFESSKINCSGHINYDLLSPNEVIFLLPALCKEQLGCRFLQSKIETVPYYAEQCILPYVCHMFIEIINDQFGNYLVQKILNFTGSETITSINSIVKFKYIINIFNFR